MVKKFEKNYWGTFVRPYLMIEKHLRCRILRSLIETASDRLRRSPRN